VREDILIKLNRREDMAVLFILKEARASIVAS
jgi:hypothetical protein